MAKKSKEGNTQKKEKKVLTLKQKNNLAKGRNIMKKALEIQKNAGKKTITKTVYKMTMGEAMKKAAKSGGFYKLKNGSLE